MSRPRVVLTGVGALAATGIGALAFWQALLQRRSGIDRVTRVSAEGLPPLVAGEVRGFEPERMTGGQVRARHLARHTQFALAATLEAYRDAALPLTDLRPDSAPVGVLVGVSMGGFDFIEREIRRIVAHGNAAMRPSVIGCIHIAAAAAIAEALQVRARLCTFSNSCTGGLDAVAQAARWIEEGRCDVAFAGGCDAPIETCLLAGFSAAQMLASPAADPSRSSRPFDLDRTGGVLSEGAGIVVLEDYEMAKARGAKIYAEIVGYGMSGDAHHISSPSEDGDGPSRVMHNAIADAGIAFEQIGYVNAHGTSTPAGDRIECTAIRRTFGAHADKLKVSSTKSMHGHLLGAAGGLETIVCALACKTGRIPGTMNIENQDPDCNLDVCANASASFDAEYVLNNNFGFGGTNACVVLRRV